MLRRSTFMILLSLFAVAIFTVGCSDDETTPSGPVVGDPNSADFQATRAAIATTVDSTVCQLFEFAADPDPFRITSPYDTVGDIRIELGVTSPADTVWYNYVDGWHILYIGLTSLANYNATFVDSARFMDGKTVQTHVDDNTDAMYYVFHHNYQYDGSGQVYANISMYANAAFTGYQSENQVINAMGNLAIEDHYLVDQTEMTKTYEFTVTVEDLAYVWNQDMPWDQITVTGGTVTLACTISDGTTTTTWSATVHFDPDGTGNVHAATGNTTYDYDMTLFDQ
jgi:hypothetical protein